MVLYSGFRIRLKIALPTLLKVLSHCILEFHKHIFCFFPAFSSNLHISAICKTRQRQTWLFNYTQDSLIFPDVIVLFQ